MDYKSEIFIKANCFRMDRLSISAQRHHEEVIYMLQNYRRQIVASLRGWARKARPDIPGICRDQRGTHVIAPEPVSPCATCATYAAGRLEHPPDGTCPECGRRVRAARGPQTREGGHTRDLEKEGVV